MLKENLQRLQRICLRAENCGHRLPLFAGHVLQSCDSQLVFAAGKIMVQRTLGRAAAAQDLIKSGGMESLRTEQFAGRVEKPGASFSSFSGSFYHLFSRRLRRLTNRPV